MKSTSAGTRLYRTIWRWHFYAGLFCLPFVIILSITGALYLFKPQIDTFVDRQTVHISLQAPAHSIDDQVMAARALFPDARLKGIELRDDPTDATRVLLMQNAEIIRVYVRPDTLEILKTIPENARFTKVIRNIHGELLAGETGAIIVELAGAWALVMVMTGLYLWWPRSNSGLGGILYPRLGSGKFIRDLHAVTGIWISILAIFFLVSALPWTKVWGGSFKELRQIAAGKQVHQDWTTGPAAEHAMHRSEFGQASSSMNDGMGAMMPSSLSFDDIAAIIRPMRIAGPVLVAPPSPVQPRWRVSSDAQNRTLHVSFEIDPASGTVSHRTGFNDGKLVDKVIGIAVSAHEGQLFGWVNQALGLLTAIGYLTLAASGIVMWWRRRPQYLLGAPKALTHPARLAPVIVTLILVLAVLLPTLGISLAFVLIVERVFLSRIPAASLWLGLQPDRT